jgi:hypothetical protein
VFDGWYGAIDSYVGSLPGYFPNWQSVAGFFMPNYPSSQYVSDQDNWSEGRYIGGNSTFWTLKFLSNVLMIKFYRAL